MQLLLAILSLSNHLLWATVLLMERKLSCSFPPCFAAYATFSCNFHASALFFHSQYCQVLNAVFLFSLRTHMYFFVCISAPLYVLY